MRKNLTKKLFLSVLTLAFAVISLGASTYAWFVMSSDTKVDTFTATVKPGESGLVIAVSEIPVGENTVDTSKLTWRSTALNLATDFAAATNVNFTAVQNAKNFAGDAFKTLKGNAKVNEDYVAFRLYFKLADADEKSTGDVYLTDYDLVNKATINPWYVNKDYKDSTGTTVVAGNSMSYNVVDAARLALVPDGGNALIYEVEDAPAADSPLANRSSGYGQNGAYDYYKNVLGTADLANYPADGYYTISKLDATAATKLGTITGTGYISVDVYVWIEGWDQECINAIFEQVLNVTLKFSLNGTRQEAEPTVDGE